METSAPEHSLVQTRPVTSDDEAFLRELFAGSRDDLALLPAELRDQLLDLQYAARRDQRTVAHPCADHVVLLREGVEAGAMVVDRSSAEIHLVDLEVGTSHRRQGVARAVVGGLLAEAAAAGRSVRLQVWSDNHAARALYAELGFDGPDGEGHLLLEATPTTSRRARHG